MRKFRFVAALAAVVVVLAGCGGGGDDSSKFSDPGTTTPGGGSTPTAAAITVTSSMPSMLSDGSVSAQITALAKDASNNLMQGVAVTFTASSGGIAVSQGTTDASGAAKATLSTAGDTAVRTITVTATAGSLHATVNVAVVAAPSSITVQMGSLSGTTFTPNTIAISTDTLSAGGTTGLSVVLQKSDGTLYATSADITFTSPCSAQGLASINSPVTTTTGVATATYVAKGCSGSDLITASATIDGASVSATGSVTVATAAIGSIQFEKASPTNIALKGTGGSGRPETSTVSFLVFDASGSARANADVTFSLDTTVGGMNLTTTSAKSDASGRVQTIVNAGTVATPVRVTARIASPAISTQSNGLTITTGIPDTDSFSLSVQCPNAEAFDYDGVTVPVTARLSDRFNNLVPDGTAVAFKPEGGQMVAQCTTTNGACTVNWTSSDPRPLLNGKGRVTILATAIGEDSFVDSNSNGYYDSGELFANLGEPYRDDDESLAYTSGEFFLDFDNDGTRSSGDGVFSGVTCTGTSPGSTCSLTTTAIGAQAYIVMSSAHANVVGPASTSLAAKGTQNLTYVIKDTNGNSMAVGTIIDITASAGAGTVSGTTSYTIACDDSQSGVTMPITLKAADTAGSGLITVRVTSKPSNTVTLYTTSVTVTP
jgi:hypothetical protein